MHQLIVTAVGPDRVGLVADLTRYVHQAGASIADSRMINLRGHFALLALIEGRADALAALRGTLKARAAELGLRVDLEEFGGGKAPGARTGQEERTEKVVAGERVPYRLKGYAPDQPGIVARVTDVLRKHHVNVEELETRVESTPFAGTPMFLIEAVITVPSAAGTRKLRQDLEALGDQIGCDVDLDHL